MYSMLFLHLYIQIRLAVPNYIMCYFDVSQSLVENATANASRHAPFRFPSTKLANNILKEE